MGREKTKPTPIEYSASRVWIVKKENTPKEEGALVIVTQSGRREEK